MLELLGDVDGLTILDAGCGSGVLAQELASRGAQVVGVDSSSRMLDRARMRLGETVELRVHDLQQPLGWASDQSFDIVVSSLALHYMEDWKPALSEFRRILKVNGRLVFSTHHPFADFVNFERPNYFAVEPIGDTWSTSGARYDVTFWRRPLGRIIEDVVSNGFTVDHVVEPTPKELDAFSEEGRSRLTSQPWFILIAAHKGSS
jgi:ubiquinone/menaquinone biosynthesis C-methylase UbiE